MTDQKKPGDNKVTPIGKAKKPTKPAAQKPAPATGPNKPGGPPLIPIQVGKGKPQPAGPGDTARVINIYERLAEFTQRCKGVQKRHFNPHFKSEFANLDDLWQDTKPLLREIGIGVLQIPSTISGPDYPVTQVLVTQLYCVGENSPPFGSPEFAVTGQMLIPMDRAGPQAMGSGLTYVRRYHLFAMLNISDYDDDAESAEAGLAFQAAAEDAKANLKSLIDQSSDPSATFAFFAEKYGVSSLEELSNQQVATMAKLLAAKLAKQQESGDDAGADDDQPE